MKSSGFFYTDDIKIWDELFNLLPIEKQDIYFTSAYYRVSEFNGEGKPVCFCFADGNNIALYPFLLNNVNNLGYNLQNEYNDLTSAYGYSGIATNISDLNLIEKFQKSVQEYCKNNNIVAGFVRFHPLIKNHDLSENRAILKKDRDVIAINIEKDYEEIWNSDYSSKCRNMIRKANKLGYTARIVKNPSENELMQFMKIYYHSMNLANADKYYFFSKEYFINLFNFLSEHTYIINIINAENTIVCSSIFFHYKNYFHYHLSGRNSLADNSVNNLLIDNAVKFAKKLGAKTMHLGGGRTPSEDDSLFNFKKNFSKWTLPFYFEKNIFNKDIYNEIVVQWENKNPEKKEILKYYLLKYRH